jgi:hypothetical protein
MRDSSAGQTLARRLRQLRDETWPDVDLTQVALADALSTDGEKKLGSATVASWENTKAPKLPPSERLAAYARFFATPRSLRSSPPALVALDTFTPEEDAVRTSLEAELLALHRAAQGGPAANVEVWRYPDSDMVTLICPDTPREFRGPLGEEQSLNFTEMHAYADVDALIHLYGHIRAANPSMNVVHQRASQIQPHVLRSIPGHLVLVGGAAWSDVTGEVLEKALKKVRLPVRQNTDLIIPEGDIFEISGAGETRRVYPELVVEQGRHIRGPYTGEGPVRLYEDVGWFARMPNPFNAGRTLTLCNGIYSRGVVGSVLAFTHPEVRVPNERYLAGRFAGKEAYSLLFRVELLSGQALPPNLSDPEMRLHEWPVPAEREP